MSGHSHWSTIKHRKATTDAKRGKIFSKLSRLITLAAKEKGSDPQTNPKLRMAIEKAREFNVPKENIEKAIKRGTGELESATLEEFLFEAYGPGGIAIIIEGVTDNKNRVLNDIRNILSTHGGKLAETGTVKWLFERKGCATINIENQPTTEAQDKELKIKKDELELLVIEVGAEDICWHNNILDVYTKIEDLEKVKKNLENRDIKIEFVSLDWVAKNQIPVEKKNEEACQKLCEALDDNDDVQEIYSNLKT